MVLLRIIDGLGIHIRITSEGRGWVRGVGVFLWSRSAANGPPANHKFDGAVALEFLREQFI
jgi:hypothetical protein